MFLVSFSKWYKIFSRVVIKNFVRRTLVITFNTEAITILVDRSPTRLLFYPNNSTDLAVKIE